MSIIEHYTPHGSASPDWIRQMRAMEADCDFAATPPPVPQPVPVPIPEAA